METILKIKAFSLPKILFLNPGAYFRSILPNAYDGPYPRERRNPDFRVNYAPLTRGKMYALDMAKNFNQVMNEFYYSKL